MTRFTETPQWLASIWLRQCQVLAASAGTFDSVLMLKPAAAETVDHVHSAMKLMFLHTDDWSVLRCWDFYHYKLITLEYKMFPHNFPYD